MNLNNEHLSHEEVVGVGEEILGRFKRLVDGILLRI